MMFRTHIAFGALCGLIALSLIENPANKYVFILFAVLGSAFPDVDTPHSKFGRLMGPISKYLRIIAGHRGIFHSIFFAILIPGLIWFLVSKPYGLAMFAGYFSHLMIDSVTKQGIDFLHPVAKFHVSGLISTGKRAEKVIFMMILVGIAIMIL